jgi:hypothetical protein
LQALWPLQALAAMHLPSAAFAVVDPVDRTAPARNRVAAAAASVAPDLESNFMTISSKFVDTEMRCRRSQNRTAKSPDAFSNREGSPGSLEVHPELGTGIERIWLQRFQKKVSFFNLDSPSMPNTGS